MAQIANVPNADRRSAQRAHVRGRADGGHDARLPHHESAQRLPVLERAGAGRRAEATDVQYLPREGEAVDFQEDDS